MCVFCVFHCHCRLLCSRIMSPNNHGWMSREECFFRLRASVWMCVKFPLRVIGKGNYSAAVTLAAASPAHFTQSQTQPLLPSPEISLSTSLTENELCSDVLVTWSFLPPWLLVAAPRPEATRQWFISHVHRSAPAASDRTPPPRAHHFSSPPTNCSSLISVCLYCCLCSPGIHRPTVLSSVDDK